MRRLEFMSRNFDKKWRSRTPSKSSNGRLPTTTEQNSAYFTEGDEDGGGRGAGGGPFEILSCLRLSVDIFP
jgi:hypothetical protein